MLDGTVDVYTLDPLEEEAMRNNAPLKPSATFFSSRNPHSYGQFTWGGLLLEHQGASSVQISYNTGMLYALEGMRGGGRLLSWDMVKDDEESACWVPFAPGEPAPLSFSRSPLGGTFAVGDGGGSFAVADQRILGQGGDRGTIAKVEGAHAGGVNSVAWGRFGASWLATGGQDGIIKVCRLDSPPPSFASLSLLLCMLAFLSFWRVNRLHHLGLASTPPPLKLFRAVWSLYSWRRIERR